jgi:hypothetical protein
MTKSRFLAALTLLICSSFALANRKPSARTEEEVQLKGVIVDWQDARIVNASILIEAKSFRRELNSDQLGEFSTPLPIGTYRITVSHPVFKTSVIRKLKLFGSDIRLVKVMLKVKAPPTSGKCPKGSLCL